MLLSISFHFFSRFQQLRQPLSTEIIRQAVISDDLKYLEAVSDENLVFVWRADANDSLFCCLFFLFFFSSSFLFESQKSSVAAVHNGAPVTAKVALNGRSAFSTLGHDIDSAISQGCGKSRGEATRSEGGMSGTLLNCVGS